MQTRTFSFSRQKVAYHFDASFADLKTIAPQKKSVIITDEHVFSAHKTKFKGLETIIIKAGEQHKVQATVDSIVLQLIGLGIDRQSMLIGVGGGVITDLTGYVASIFLRGIPFGFVPTTLLAMVDASIGGKNGIDVGVYKNMVGTINQPNFLLFDASLLKTLPEIEWQNGFAEIIKHAAIKDAAMFKQLEEESILGFQKKKGLVQALVMRNALIKTRVVQEDEFEKGERRLLNFGHTLAHAIETQYGLMHGEAVAIGMVFAAHLSEEMAGFKFYDRLKKLVLKYGLPVDLAYSRDQVFEVLRSDKKKEADFMNFILLERLGKAQIKKIPLKTLYNHL